MSISLGVGAAVGVPAALPHDGDPTVPPGEDVVNPSNTLRNFFISPGRSCVCSGRWAGSKRRLCLLGLPRVCDLLSDAGPRLVNASGKRNRRLPEEGYLHTRSLLGAI